MSLVKKLKHILVVDDHTAFCKLFTNSLTPMGYQVHTAHSATETLSLIKNKSFSLVFLDVFLGKDNGLDVLQTIQRQTQVPPVIVMSARAKSTEDVVRAIRMGAHDYLIKPFEIKNLITLTNTLLRDKTSYQEYPDTTIIGQSSHIRSVLDIVHKARNASSPVLIEGDTGVGKEMIARTLHQWGNRCDYPFITINCAAVPENLFESELFGHVKGAFTDARTHKSGLFSAAHEGILFLDEIAEMPHACQGKLLRVLQEKRFRKIGATREEPTDVRIITATNKNLWNQVGQKCFRKDLYFRLNVIRVHIPPLHHHSSDIPLLVDYFMRKYAYEMEMEAKTFTSDAMNALRDYPWPGNVRELENLIQKLLILVPSPHIDRTMLEQHLIVELFEEPQPCLNVPTPHSPGYTLKKGILEYEKSMFTLARKLSNSAKECMSILGLSKREYYYRLKHLSLDN